ncbi:MAG: excinuclease ABC subunit UvrC [Gammaproteobacteria bacterium]
MQSAEIDNLLKTLPGQPGVYKMLDAEGKVIYVGKAANLKKRVSSYFQKAHPDPKTVALVSHIQNIETIITHTESEALLLENNLIKSLKPRYNILYRDDKSYPYIYVSTDQLFPRLSFHRGAQHGKGRYFGPYPSAGAVRETLALLQKLFPVRQCKDSFYKNRSRPCLQYQIKRCTAPCVGYVSQEDYAEDVRHAIMFLEGKSNQVVDELATQMEQAALELAYERAAMLRDQISSLRRVQEKQYISRQGGNYDIIAAAVESGLGCVQVFTIRNGRNLGNKSYFPKQASAQTAAALLDAFIPQYYLRSQSHAGREIPANILISEQLADVEILTEALSTQAGRRIQLQHNVRGERVKWLEMARQNAAHAIKIRVSTHATTQQRFEALQEALQLDELPQRIECFDISHTQGERTVASCVVFDQTGAVKSDYRRYNIDGITGGDDYAAMRQAVFRRYQKLQAGEGNMPDILFIDGGKGQVNQAKEVFDELQIADVMIIGVAKGPTRKAGLETLLVSACLSDKDQAFILPADSAALHLIQQIRDEAHRFAITGHRQRRNKARTRSVLEEIDGLGPKRRQQLLRQFGGMQEVARAGVDDLASVPGISRMLAQKIYDAFHMNN